MKGKQKFKYRGYVPYTVDKAIKVAVSEQSGKIGDVLNDWIVKWAEDGYKVTFAYEGDTSAYVVTMFTADGDNPNNGLILSCRHADLVKAFALLVVMHENVTHGKWPNPESDADQYDW